MTASQYRAANQLLMKQNREMGKKTAALAATKDKDKREIRKQMIENARGKVMNYALKQNERDKDEVNSDDSSQLGDDQR